MMFLAACLVGEKLRMIFEGASMEDDTHLFYDC